MKRLALSALVALVGSGCVVHAVAPEPLPPEPPPVAYAPAPAPPPMTRVFYYGEHALPGGGWCYIDGTHEHDFYPERADYYAYENGYYLWRGPLVINYYAGHPLPGGGWCYIAGPHVHDYYPPRDTYWLFTPGRGYVYRGPYSAVRPAPAHYWGRPAPAPVYRAPLTPAPVYRAPAPAPAPRVAPGRPSYMTPAPAPAPSSWRPAPPAPAPGPASSYAPGHGNVPPGQGGIPPGQAKKFEGERRGLPPPPPAAAPAARAAVPPGQGGVPPGQAKKIEGERPVHRAAPAGRNERRDDKKNDDRDHR